MTHDVLHITDASFFDSLRHELRSRVKAKLGHIDEAIAAALGFGSRAALLAAFSKDGELRVRPDEAAFIARITELGGQADPGALEDAYMEITTYSSSFRAIFVEDPGERGDEEDDWTDPSDLDEDDPLRMSWEHDSNSRGNR